MTLNIGQHIGHGIKPRTLESRAAKMESTYRLARRNHKPSREILAKLVVLRTRALKRGLTALKKRARQ